MGWRISAGVSAISFVVLMLLAAVETSPGILGGPRHSAITAMIALTGLICLAVADSPSTLWMQSVVVSVGVSCLFVALIDIGLGAIRKAAVKAERREKEFYDEIALDIGYAYGLSLWQYRAMRDGLDTAVAQGLGTTAARRVALLLNFGHKAKNLPEHLEILNVPGLKAQLEREIEIAELTSNAANKYRLTDFEYFYLAAAITARADPARIEFSEKEPIGLSELPLIVENSAELIVRRRLPWPIGAVAPNSMLLRQDPLAVIEELAERARRIPDAPFGSLGADETEITDGDNT